MPPIDEDSIFADDESTKITDGAEGAKAPEQSADAASSTATDANKAAEQPDTLSIVRDVVKAGQDPAAASSAKGQEEGKQPDDQAAPKELDEENYSDVPFNKHPRFQKLLGELKTTRVDAQRYRNVETFIGEQGLSAEQAAEVLTIAGLMRTNPAEAWKRMQPKVKELAIAAGEILPDDLKTRVQAGEISRDDAIELSRTRATVKSHELNRELDATRAEEHRAATEQKALTDAASSWAADRAERDPNFMAKLPAVQDQVKLLIFDEGRPNTPQGVQDQLRRAYEKVNQGFTAPAAQHEAAKPAVTPVTGGRVSSAATTPAAPKNTLEIIQAEIAKRA